jgi:hypothetical protein
MPGASQALERRPGSRCRPELRIDDDDAHCGRSPLGWFGRADAHRGSPVGAARECGRAPGDMGASVRSRRARSASGR